MNGPTASEGFHVGVSLPNFDRDASPAAIRDVAQAADDLGYDSVWVTQHVAVPESLRFPYNRVYESLTTLSWLAPQVARIQLGTSILVLPFYSALMLGKMTSTLSDLSDGRFILGFGVGYVQEEYAGLGVPFEERGARTDHALETIVSIWNGTFPLPEAAPEYQGLIMGPAPTIVPELWVGRLAQYGGTWHPSFLGPDEARASLAETPGLRIIPRYEAELTECGGPRNDRRDKPHTLIGDDATVSGQLSELRASGLAGVILVLGHQDPQSVIRRMEHLSRRILPDVV